MSPRRVPIEEATPADMFGSALSLLWDRWEGLARRGQTSPGSMADEWEAMVVDVQGLLNLLTADLDNETETENGNGNGVLADQLRILSEVYAEFLAQVRARTLLERRIPPGRLFGRTGRRSRRQREAWLEARRTSDRRAADVLSRLLDRVAVALARLEGPAQPEQVMRLARGEQDTSGPS